MEYKLKSVALHITNECTHKCPQCYATKENQIVCEGNIEVLKQAALKLREAGVEEINLVGGNPAEYSQILELVKYLHLLGFRVPILSNTHIYKNTSIEEITPFVSSLEWTVHGPSEKVHDDFCGVKGAFRNSVERLTQYKNLKREEQQIGIVMNIMPHNYSALYESVINVLEQGLPIDYVMIQRTGPFGKAENSQEFDIRREELIIAFEQIRKINEELKIESIPVDAYPFCVIPEEFHEYLAKCDWGYSTAAMDINGNLSRCAVGADYSLGNVLTTPVEEIWNNSPSLQRFRNKEFLRTECQACDKLGLCGGGCAISCGDISLRSDALVLERKQIH